MKGTDIMCGVNACKYYNANECQKKIVMLNGEGKCLSMWITTRKSATHKAAKDAAEGVLMYGA